MKREEIIEEKIAWQIEEKYDGNWWLVCETSKEVTEETLKKEYEKMKNRGQCVRLLKWSKIVKYEAIDGEGF